LISQDPEAAKREAMVGEQIEGRGIRNPELLRVMRAIPRHRFVPGTVRSLVYEDRPLPIGHEATISQPYVVALMTDLLQVSRRHRVLEIGTGSGYQAAILGRLAGEVYSIEIVPELAQSAAGTLRSLGIANVTVRHGDGYRGWPEKAPFDRIIVTAAPPEIPQALIDQLAKGGRLIAPVGSSPAQDLTVLEKDAKGSVRRTTHGGVSFVPMRPGGK
jgi:protein-L-isoaspartate(D-aspartate) O-methyltransferase